MAYQRSNFPEKPIAGHTSVFDPNIFHPRKPNRVKIEAALPILCVGFKMDFLASKLMQKYHTLLNNLWSPTDEFRLRVHFAINQLPHLRKYFVSQMFWHENDTAKKSNGCVLR